MGGDGGDAKGLGRIPSPGGKVDHRDDVDMWRRRGVGIPPSGYGNGHRGTSSHRRVHQEATGGHSRKGGLFPHI